MSNRVVSSGVVSAVIALVVGSVFGTYGAWGLLLTQSETTAGRWVVAIAVSIFFAWVYSFFRNNFFVASSPAFRGVVFGLFIWLGSLILATLVEDIRVFAFKAPVGSTLFLTAILYSIWGGVLASTFEANSETPSVVASRTRGTSRRRA
jgi:hypothetical protein